MENCLNKLNIDKTVKPSPFFKGGEKQAQIILNEFLNEKLQHYNKDGSNPAKNFCSDLSPYLHYGHISPLKIYLKVNNIKNINTESFLEQLFVRRELSINFVYYNTFYDTYDCLPSWAKKTLQEHLIDERKIVYTQEQFENAQTHDIYWNAAQKEMLNTGKMNSYMRMYWCKKIIEWSPTPVQAYKIALYLNNKYSLDGRDANGFAGIAWCFGKHDRAWFQKPIFGLVRYMSQSGLTKKFDMKEYLIRQQNFKQEKF